MNPLSILGTGGYTLPTVSNEALLGFLGVPKDAAWLEEKTGIRGRSLNFDCVTGRKKTPEDVLDFAFHAANEAMRNAGVLPHDIDALYLATCTPHEIHFCASAIELHRRLNFRSEMIVRQSDGGCAALAPVFQDVKAHAIASGHPETYTALIVAANDVSSFIDRDRYMRVDGAWMSPAVFADGAGAVVLGPSMRRPFLTNVYCAQDGNHPLVRYKGGGTARPTSHATLDDHVYLMDGRDVALQFGPAMGRVLSNLLYRSGLSPDRVGRWYLHQANLRLIERFVAQQKILRDRAPYNVDSLGNTVSASTLLLLHDDMENDRMPTSEPIVFAFVGAGMMEGGAIFQQPKQFFI